MRFLMWILGFAAAISFLLLLAVGWMYLGDMTGAHTVGHLHGATLLTSGEGRLIIISSAFRTGQFAPHYLTMAIAPMICCFVCTSVVGYWSVSRNRFRGV